MTDQIIVYCISDRELLNLLLWKDQSFFGVGYFIFGLRKDNLYNRLFKHTANFGYSHRTQYFVKRIKECKTKLFKHTISI